jgi:hypothetical protein
MRPRMRLIFSIAAVGVGIWGGVVVGRRVAASSARQTARPPCASVHPDATRKSGASRPDQPPRFREAGTSQREPLQSVPGERGYDPVRFIGILSPRKIFDSEPRSPFWAHATEEALQSELSFDLRRIAPEITSVEVECKTTTCRISWSGEQSARDKLTAAITALYPPARMGAHSEAIYVAYFGGRGHGDLPMGDPVALLERLSVMRAENLRIIHLGGYPSHFYSLIPKHLWPEN